MMVTNSADTIIGLMENQINIYDEFNELAKEKRKAIESEDIERLDKIVKIEQALIMKVSRLESKRRKILIDYGKENNLDANQVEKSFEKDMDEVSKQRLDMVKRKFKKKLEDQEKSNLVNEKLINSKLEYVNFALDKFLDRKTNYTKENKQNKIISENLFDKKI